MAAKGSGSVSLGVTIGCAVAAVLSWINASLVWAIIHGFFGWFYVVYWLIVKN